MFDFLKGGKVNLTIGIDRPSGIYYPGDTVHIIVSLGNDKELKFQEGRVALLYQEKFQYRTTSHRIDSKGHSHTETVSRWQNNEQEVAKQVFLGETILPEGSTRNFEFDAAIPVSAPATYPGNIIQVNWLVKATIDRKLSSDINAEAPLFILIPPASPQASTQLAMSHFGLSNEPSEAQLTLELQGIELVSGEIIKGILFVTPQKDFDATELRIELECLENVNYDLGNQNVNAYKVKLAGKTKFTAGESSRFPFQVQVPQPCSPSGSSNNWSVSWNLKGILARFMRKDTSVEQEIKVYTGNQV
jgi:sporulation-control protein spo0M